MAHLCFSTYALANTITALFHHRHNRKHLKLPDESVASLRHMSTNSSEASLPNGTVKKEEKGIRISPKKSKTRRRRRCQKPSLESICEEDILPE
ncbi:hypothetical protein K504DRAFT_456738 [Pleomassaria siparia CBS 279.74]|uniref:Uncharacterized protein n=1 Tax=Pleomassaria siparia CBS 279.74 TaxID=1314801 RepID=A0A6G1KNN2_9PLEO|nr:hypothetical protein K504DRAFT_456738 [Pleomassaria siparia CBS 279.74]